MCTAMNILRLWATYTFIASVDPPQYKIGKLGMKLGTSSDQDWEIGKKIGLIRLGIGNLWCTTVITSFWRWR